MYPTGDNDLLYAFSRTQYQRGVATATDPAVTYIHQLLLQTPIPETQFLSVVEKVEEEVKNKPKQPEPKPKPKPAAPQGDIYAILRAAQGITGPSEGPKKLTINPNERPYMPGMSSLVMMNPRANPNNDEDDDEDN